MIRTVPVRKAEIAAVRDGLAVSPARGPFTHRESFCWCLLFSLLILVWDIGEAAANNPQKSPSLPGIKDFPKMNPE